VNLGILAGLTAMACYGVGSVLQALAARRTTTAQGLDPRLLARLMTQVPYIAGLALDLLGFVFNVLALQSLPLFLVQCMIAGSVGVTALVSVPLLHAQLGRRGLLDVVVLLVGLILLATSAEAGPARELAPPQQWLLLASALAVGAASVLAFRLRERSAFWVLSALAGLAFAGVGVAARALLLPSDLWRVALSPIAWALAVFGILGMLLFASALQRGSVTVASGLMFAVEVLVASIVGFVLLGDIVPSGSSLGVAVVGVGLAVAGAIRLADQGHPHAA